MNLQRQLISGHFFLPDSFVSYTQTKTRQLSIITSRFEVAMGTLKFKQSLTEHQSGVWNICWHPNGTDLASYGKDKTIIIWGLEEFHKPDLVIKLKILDVNKWIREIAWSSCGNYIIGGMTGTITMWDKKTGQLVCNMTSEEHNNKVKSVSLISGHILHATYNENGSMWVWEVKDDEYKCTTVINAHTERVMEVRWHPHEEILASASSDMTVRIFKEVAAKSNWLPIAILPHVSAIQNLSWDKIGNRIATLSDNQTLKIWREYKPGNDGMGAATPNNESDWKCVFTFLIYDLTYCNNKRFGKIDWCMTTGLLVIACGKDIIIFKEDSDCDPHQPNFTTVCLINNAHSTHLSCVQWNPTIPGQLASASDDGSVHIWFYNEVTMSHTAENKGMPLKDIVSAINKFAAISIAASWNKVGLLVKHTEPKIVSHILLTNDLTEDVMDEAIRLKTDLIITHHPLIFAPLKSITTASWKERIAARCLEYNIAVISPHISFYSVKGGVNDWLAEAFELESSKPIGFGRLCTLKSRISIDEAVNLVKQWTNLKYVRLTRARGTDGYINTVALCAGSGVSDMEGISADLYLTGEMKHHDVLDVVHQGIHVILTNHSDLERGFLKIFASILNRSLHKPVEVCVSESDKDQLQTA